MGRVRGCMLGEPEEMHPDLRHGRGPRRGGRRPASRGATAPMKRLALFVTTLALIVGAPGATAGPGTHGVASDNVEHVAFIPFEVGTATGAKVIGKHLYVTSWKSFSIYDISDPLDPQQLSQTNFGFKFENENVSTNGE